MSSIIIYTTELLLIFYFKVFIFKKFYPFVYFWLHWVFVAARRLSLAAASRGYSLWWLLLLWSTGSRAHGLQSLQFTGSRARAQLLCMDLVALQHVGSSRIKDWTGVPCIGKWTSGASQKSLIFPTIFCCLVAKSCLTHVWQFHGLQCTRLLCPWDLSGKNSGVGCHFLPQIFPTQGSNPGLLHWQVDSLSLSHQGTLTTPYQIINSLRIETRSSPFTPRTPPNAQYIVDAQQALNECLFICYRRA